MSSSTTSTLYERIGGAQGVDDLVVEFYERVLHDDELAPFFHGVKMDHLHHMQVAFFTIAAGGPTAETPSSIKTVHGGRGIADRHYRRFVGHLLDTLEARGLSEEDVDAIIDHLALERDNVVDDAGMPD
jgi:hemoglobin